MGKQIVAARDLRAGHVLTADDLALKSPAVGGLPPYELDRVVGMRLRRALVPDEGVTLADVEHVAADAAAAL
jgi:N-acetylneuraminate synthase/sialic acid synthase